MPTYQRCPESVNQLANEIMCQYPDHAPLLDAKVKIDFVFAFADVDEKTGVRTNVALTRNGVQALGLTRKLSLKDRAMGRGDAEIALDADYWLDVAVETQRALLDHELHHLAVKMSPQGAVKRDDLNRPVLEIRHHDHDFGWFDVIAKRHGQYSIEQQQAKLMLEHSGQYYWPDLVGESPVTMTAELRKA